MDASAASLFVDSDSGPSHLRRLSVSSSASASSNTPSTLQQMRGVHRQAGYDSSLDAMFHQ